MHRFKLFSQAITARILGMDSISSATRPPDNMEKGLGLILFASDQVWPNLFSLAHHHAAGHLRCVRIYQTSKMQVRGERLERFVRDHFGVKDVRLVDNGGGVLPQEIRDQLNRWISEQPELQWEVNASGGMKLFPLATIGLPERVRILNRDIDGHWYRTQNGPSGPEAHLEPPGTMDETRGDELPIEKLAILQFGADVEISAPPSIHISNFRNLTRELCNNQWHWRNAFRACGIDMGPHEKLAGGALNGFLFETYVSGAIRLMTRNSRSNLTIRHNKIPRLEADSVVLVGGGFYCIELKYYQPGGQGISMMEGARKLALGHREMGGLGATAILINTWKVFPEADKQFVRSFLRVQVLDLGDTTRLFSSLAGIMKVPLPLELQDAEGMIHSYGGMFPWWILDRA